jgi:hypothetical protein
VKTLWTKGAFKLETTAANKLQFSVQNHVAGDIDDHFRDDEQHP